MLFMSKLFHDFKMIYVFQLHMIKELTYTHPDENAQAYSHKGCYRSFGTLSFY